MKKPVEKFKEKDRFSLPTVADQHVHTRGRVFQGLLPAESENASSVIIG